MDLNTRGRYAVMAMAELARNGDGHALPLSAIADRQQLSVAYLEQIFLKLRRAGLVESARGRSGGYRLTKPATDISIAAIMQAAEEETRMTRCMGEDGIGCVGEEKCLTHCLWQALGDKIRTFLSNVSLQDVLDGMPKQRAAAAAGARTGA